MPALEAKDWAPFKLDALGIVTLLGTESLRQSISRLVHNGFAEYLPLLAPQIIADNTITNVVPGFALYNITDGVLAIDLSAWWTRWLTCQTFNWNTTVLDIYILPQKRSPVTTSWFVILCLNAIIDAAIIVIPVLLDDWYGFAASVSLVGTVISRAYILSSLRQSIDDFTTEADKQTDAVKLFLTLLNGRAITIRTTRGITINILLTTPRPKHPFLYRLFQGIDWVALGVLVVSLGSASLCMQITLIGVLSLATHIVVQRYNCDELHIGRRLEITQNNLAGEDRRGTAYINLNLSEEEEKALISWHLLPMKYNKFLWGRYENDKCAAGQIMFQDPVVDTHPAAGQTISYHPVTNATPAAG